MNRLLRKFTLMMFVWGLGFFAVSCSASTPQPPTQASVTTSALGTSIATKQPSPTALPSVTTTRQPTLTGFFLQPSSCGGLCPPQVTPVFTPEHPQVSYHLKPLTEPDALNLIRELDQYAHDADVYGPAGSRGAFVESQLSIRFIIQEAMQRFPNLSYADEYLWHLEFSRAVRNEAGVDEWVMERINQAINGGGYSLDTLNDLLNLHGFNMNDIHPVSNLFGDGKQAWVFNVRTNDESVSDGLFLVARQRTPSGYQLFKLVSQWAFSVGDSSIQDIADVNKNNLPDITLNIGRHSGTSCQREMQIYEWNGTAFYDLSKGGFHSFDCDTDWNIVSGGSVPMIVASQNAQQGGAQYTWNGKFYEFSGYTNATPWQAWYYAADAGTNSPSNDVIQLPALLDSPDALKNGSTYPDYLRFRLGVAYALLSKPEQAIAEMQKLISSPRDPFVKVFSELAKAFLETYKGDVDLYQACVKTDQLDQATRKQYNDDDSALADGYGLSQDVLYGSRLALTFPCDMNAAFNLLLKTIPANSSDIPKLLRQNGVEIAYSAGFDLNNDGQQEWLVVDKQELWYLIALQDGIFQAHEAGGGSEKIPETVQVAHWTDVPDPALILQGKTSLDIFTVNKDFETNIALSAWKLKSFRIPESQTAPQIQLVYQDHLPPDDYYPSAPWEGYRWDAESQAFKDDLLEYKLFVENDHKGAAQIAATALPLWDHWAKQQLDMFGWDIKQNYYLAGLAYQLAGNDQKAAQIYWQLWHDYPESPYALMARAKLVPDKP